MAGFHGLVAQQLDRMTAAYAYAVDEGAEVYACGLQIVSLTKNDAELALNQSMLTSKVHMAPAQNHFGA